MNKSLKRKVVLITGANGFIGSHLTRRLLGEEAEIHILLKKDSDQWRIKDIIDKLSIWHGDLRDYDSVSLSLKKIKPQIIFHLAAFRNVARDTSLLDQMIDVNIKGSVNLLRAVIEKKIDIECLVNTGTCEEYGDGAVPFREDQREIPVSPYSASKVAATYFYQMISKTMGSPVVTLRPFLTYGPFQDDDMFIPSLITHCLKGENFAMTAGDQTREFNYVSDIIDAYIRTALSARKAAGEIINIGNGVEYRVRDVAERIVKMMGSPISLLMGAAAKRPGETEHFFCSNEKAKRLLDWSPAVGLDEGLKKTIEWYTCNFGKR